MQIRVTQADIDTGKPGKTCTCPVARAINRILNGSHFASVSNAINIFRCGGAQLKLQILFPQSVRNFIYRFDSRQPVQPLDFDIEIPEYLCKSE